MEIIGSKLPIIFLFLMVKLTIIFTFAAKLILLIYELHKPISKALLQGQID